MDFQENFGNREIRFTLRKSDPELLEKLAFIHLVEMKFGGEEPVCGWFHFQGNVPFIQVTLSFPDWTATSDAKAHCNQFLDDNGSVISNYRGALTYADPNYVMAGKLKNRALDNRLDDDKAPE